MSWSGSLISQLDGDTEVGLLHAHLATGVRMLVTHVDAGRQPPAHRALSARPLVSSHVVLDLELRDNVSRLHANFANVIRELLLVS